jgi:hypothetical protein
MALKPVAIAVVLFLALEARSVVAQTVTTEADVTAGYSTDDTQAMSTQLRVFGEAMAGWRFYAEGTWARQWGNQSDAFGAAYPYDKRIHPMEVYAEKTVQSGRYIAGTRLGRFRSPFGLYTRADQAYGGFVRPPLIRYGNYWGLSNNFLEGGASVIAGMPNLYAEVSLGVPQDEDPQHRRNGLDAVGRVQGAIGSLIVGVSHIRTRPSEARQFARGTTMFTGVDVRWMRDGFQIRGEWIGGRPFDLTRTFGGYVDALIHRPAMGPVTAVARVERLDYEAGPFSRYPRRYTAGARIRVSSILVGYVNVVRQPDSTLLAGTSALDLGLTFTARR